MCLPPEEHGSTPEEFPGINLKLHPKEFHIFFYPIPKEILTFYNLLLKNSIGVLKW